MSKSLPLSVEREWYSLRDIREIFRVSREAITAIFKDADEKGVPIRVTVLDFSNHPVLKRERPFIRVEKKSLMAYLSRYCDAPSPSADNSQWMEWMSPRDVELVYGISHEFLKSILKDAEWNEMPIQTIRLPFVNGSQTTGRPKRYQIERRSLNAYLSAHTRVSI